MSEFDSGLTDQEAAAVVMGRPPSIEREVETLAEDIWQDEPTEAERDIVRLVLASDWLRDHDAALVAQARRDAAEEALREAADLFACEPHSTEGDESEWAEFCWRCDARVTIRAAAADVIARAGETP